MELPPDAEVQIYRITQEALQNVYKHAGASKVGVMLKNVEGAVNLSIEDDWYRF
jgi:signal transduction histidine kinase